jgi:hypothetical protein
VVRPKRCRQDEVSTLCPSGYFCLKIKFWVGTGLEKSLGLRAWFCGACVGLQSACAAKFLLRDKLSDKTLYARPQLLPQRLYFDRLGTQVGKVSAHIERGSLAVMVFTVSWPTM